MMKGYYTGYSYMGWVGDRYIEFASENGVDTESAEEALDTEGEAFDADAAKAALYEFAEAAKDIDGASYIITDEETMADEEVQVSYGDLLDAVEVYGKYGCEEPNPADYGIWVPGIPVLVEAGLDKINCAEWLSGLILDGIVAGVGAVLGFVPQMFILFFLLFHRCLLYFCNRNLRCFFKEEFIKFIYYFFFI